MIGLFDFSLGRDFWMFRFGQLASLLGDGCGMIALSWWVLDKTGSAASISVVLAPAMVVRVVLLPFMGPLADQFPVDHQFHLAGSRGGVAAAHVAQTFTEPHGGEPLSDHWGLEARYRLVRGQP